MAWWRSGVGPMACSGTKQGRANGSYQKGFE